MYALVLNFFVGKKKCMLSSEPSNIREALTQAGTGALHCEVITSSILEAVSAHTHTQRSRDMKHVQQNLI